MKKKKLTTRLSLNKKTITTLQGNAAEGIYGGVPNTYRCLTPPVTYAVNCTLGICVIKNTDGCPTTSNMCPTSPEVNCTQTA